MYINAGYVGNSRVAQKDHSAPLIVMSSGTYRLQAGDNTMRTLRPRGRVDFQLLYVAAGAVRFFFDGRETPVEAGHMILFRPGEPQRYEYQGNDYPEVFWVHFTGYDVTNILNYYQMGKDRTVFHTGTSPEYRQLFQRMILELQMCQPLYEDLLASTLCKIFLLINRQILETPQRLTSLPPEIEQAISYFHEHYNEKIQIQDYAGALHLSKDYFSRLFKNYTGMTPTQYLLQLRINNAQSLLEQTSYSISRIAASVGYSNPLYFSRIFSRVMGMSPTEYREQRQQSLAERTAEEENGIMDH